MVETSTNANFGIIKIEPWPTEVVLRILVILAGLGILVLLTISVVGIIYIAFFGIFFFLMHLVFIAHVRGSAVKLCPDQFPDLYLRVQELAGRIGMTKIPDAYVMQAGGALNALATKFLRSRMIVLYSDLLEACGDNMAARDMIIGHELGHIKRGHLNWHWLTSIGMGVPFLGSAYSQSREYTCDRYGAALCGDRSGALIGLAILAAGKERGPKVNMAELAKQKRDMNTGLLTIAKWLARHPPLCDRLAALDANLTAGVQSSSKGPIRAIAILMAIFAIPFFIAILYGIFKGPIDLFMRTGSFSVERDKEKIENDFKKLSEVVEEHRESTGAFPVDDEYSLLIWSTYRPNEPEPTDPFCGCTYAYESDGDDYDIWSPGPDAKWNTDDDIYMKK